MARKIDPKCARCRREGEKLFLKGERCYTPKCAFTRRSYVPGQHGPTARRRQSEFGLQLQEKQKARHEYDILEGQFRLYFEKAQKSAGVTGEQLLQLLETRLDNVIYRMQLAKSRRLARQLVGHGHILVNGSRVSVPSFSVKVGDEISVLESMHDSAYFSEAKKGVQAKLVPQWLELTPASMSAKVIALPTTKDVELNVALPQIIEFYSR
ncbi:MAG: 30S ribosomal protein S4 [bacterium]|nr:30S ribosomal protein S4 [bacterium]